MAKKHSRKKIVGNYLLTFIMRNKTKKSTGIQTVDYVTNMSTCNFFSRTEFLVYNEWQEYELTSGVLLKEPLFERKPGGIFHCQAKRLSSLPSAPRQLLQIYLTSWPVDTDRSTPVAYSSKLEPDKSVGERKAHASVPVQVHPRLFS